MRTRTALAAALLPLVTARCIAPGSTPRIRPGAGSRRSIAVLEKVRIGGTDQWLLERSHDTCNPIVLFVHGGPGTSELTLNRRRTRELEKHALVVNWDQRGAGKSFAAGRDTAGMTIDQFVEDLLEVTRYLLTTFGQPRLVLVGHSWGTVIATLAVARCPELFACYVGIGQVADMAEGERRSYEWTLEQARLRNDTRAVRALSTMGPPPYAELRESVVTQRRYLGRFGGEVHASRNGAFPLVFSSLLVSREYTVRDRVNVFRGIFAAFDLLWPELVGVDLFERVPTLSVPVFLVEGRHDHEAPSDLAASYLDALEAPRKQLFWFESSAHMPNWEECDRFTQIMIDHVLPVAGTHASATAGPAPRAAEVSVGSL